MFKFMRNISGAVSPMAALMLIPILGATALAVDVGYWYFKQRDMQNAADSAAIAAAQTADENASSPSYDGANDDFIKVAKGTTSRYGYIDGVDNVTVAASRVPCPADPSETCTQVQINYVSPLFFSPVIGFSGNANGGSAQGVAALAIAGDSAGGGPSYQFCLFANESTPGVDGIRANGVPFADIGGCDIFSNSDIDCNGGNLGAGTAVAVGNSSVCGEEQESGADPFDDPYEDLAEHIPTDPCGGAPANYPQAFTQGNDNRTNEVNNRLNGTPMWSGEVIRCGDVVLYGDTTLNGVTLTIFNGRLIANAHTLTATNSTIIFAGDNNALYHHYPTDTIKNGNLNDSDFIISAPTSGDWSGVAVYVDPDLTINVNVDQSGNEPALDIVGLFYSPNAEVSFSGIVDKDGAGYNCFVLFARRILINGTGQVLRPDAISQCDDAGLEVPSIGNTGGRPWLVF